MADAGIEFAIVRLGYTGTSTGSLNLDPTYKTNMTNAQAAGVHLGIYYYSQAITVAEAKKEAQYVLDNLGGYSLDLPIMFDYEYYSGGRLTSSTPNKATKTEICNAFCQTIEDAGYVAGVYANKSMFTSDLNANNIESNGHRIWLAHYTSNGYATDYSATSYEFWQCSSTESVAGISTYVDLDWWYHYPGVTTVSADIINLSGTWTYCVNGEPDYTYTGLAKNSNGWWYVEDGIVEFDETGFVHNGFEWVYAENSKVGYDQEGMYEGEVDGVKGTWYVSGGVAQTSINGLMDKSVDGNWYYLDYGRVNETTTVAKNKNGWYYVNNGIVDFTYTDFAENSNGWWYIEKGKVTFSTTGVVSGTVNNIYGKWLVEESKLTTYNSGLMNKSVGGKWYYIDDYGKVADTTTTVAKNKNGWYYVKDGVVDFTYTGFAENDNGWWYVEKGKVTFNTNSVIKDTYGAIDGDTSSWWYVVGSKVQTGTATYTGLANYKNTNGWWYVDDGKVNFGHKGVEKNKNGWWYVTGGKVDFTYTGFAENKNGWWYIESGKVTFSTNSVIKDTHGAIDGDTSSWWYVVGSKVQTGTAAYTGLANYKNSNGWWYVVDCKVDFDHSGVEKNKNGWWYVKGGKVIFSYTGIAGNSNGWWYIKNGKVDFSYNGTVKVSGETYTVKNGKVDK